MGEKIVEAYSDEMVPVEPADLFYRTGRNIVSWNTEPDGSGITYVPGTTTRFDNSVTLYAIWDNVRYTLTFNTDGGSSIAPASYEPDAVITAPANPTKTHCIFDGWEPEIPARMPWYNLTVTARWRPDTITVTFNGNGGT